MDYSQVHCVIIGYHKTINHYYINLELLRNFSFSNDLWITTIYNGNEDSIITGLGENNFIKLKEDRGYAFGALDEINEGLNHAKNFNRNIVVLFNFDILWYSERGFTQALQDFESSGKLISAAEDINGLLASDCMIFKREFLEKILPIVNYHQGYREILEIAERYKNTTLGFKNVEEWVFSTLVNYSTNFMNLNLGENPLNIDSFFKNLIAEKFWHKMDRKDLPRLRFSENLTMSHEHDLNEIKNFLIQYKSKAGFITKQLLGI